MNAQLLKNRCLNLLRMNEGGLTPDEIAEMTGLSILTVRPRITELKGQGLVMKTGIRRKNITGKTASVIVAK